MQEAFFDLRYDVEIQKKVAQEITRYKFESFSSCSWVNVNECQYSIIFNENFKNFACSPPFPLQLLTCYLKFHFCSLGYLGLISKFCSDDCFVSSGCLFFKKIFECLIVCGWTFSGKQILSKYIFNMAIYVNLLRIYAMFEGSYCCEHQNLQISPVNFSPKCLQISLHVVLSAVLISTRLVF